MATNDFKEQVRALKKAIKILKAEQKQEIETAYEEGFVAGFAEAEQKMHEKSRFLAKVAEKFEKRGSKPKRAGRKVTKTKKVAAKKITAKKMKKTAVAAKSASRRGRPRKVESSQPLTFEESGGQSSMPESLLMEG